MALIDDFKEGWTFDGDANAIISSTYDGAIDGATSDTTNKILGSGSYSYDKVNDEIEITNALKLSGDYTIAIWFRITETSGSTVTLLSKNESGNNKDFTCYYYGGDTIRFGTDDGTDSDNLDVDVGSMADGDWHLVIMTWDGTNKRIFVDGVYEGTSAPDDATIDGGVKKWQFGIDRTVLPFGGNIDDSWMWDKALAYGSVSVGSTATGEVAELWNSGDGIAYPFGSSPTTIVYNSVFMGCNF